MLVQGHLGPTRVLRSFEKFLFFVWKPYSQVASKTNRIVSLFNKLGQWLLRLGPAANTVHLQLNLPRGRTDRSSDS